MPLNQKVDLKGAQKINQKVISKNVSSAKKSDFEKQSAANSTEKKIANAEKNKPPVPNNDDEDSDTLNTGISDENSSKVAVALNQVLADEFVLYIKTLNFHWNIEGRDFHAMHLFLDEQYHQLQTIIDAVAERVRKVGHFATGSMQEFLDASTLDEHQCQGLVTDKMIAELAADHDALIRRMRTLIDEFDEKYDDAGSSDFITGVMKEHEKMAWMLRASVSQPGN